VRRGNRLAEKATGQRLSEFGRNDQENPGRRARVDQAPLDRGGLPRPGIFPKKAGTGGSTNAIPVLSCFSPLQKTLARGKTLVLVGTATTATINQSVLNLPTRPADGEGGLKGTPAR